MYFRVKAKNKNETIPQIKGIFVFFTALLIAYCLVLPKQTGALGQAVARLLFLFLGRAAFVIPFLFIWSGISIIKDPSSKSQWRLDIIWSLLILSVSAAFMNVFGKVFYNLNYGGWMGLKFGPFFTRIFGNYLAIAATAVLLVYIICLLLKISLKTLIGLACKRIADDYRQWQEARREWKKSVEPLLKESRASERISERRFEGSGTALPQARLESEPEPRIIKPQVSEPPVNTAVKKNVEIKAPKQPQPVIEGKPEEKKPYVLPPIDLMSDSDEAPRGYTQDDYLKFAELLTKILADFNIEAKVKDIIPGPVVTRYDIELAPGIKIQAVAAISENLSLAMKSPSVRIISIPEKSAVGIEVPNAQSCIVGLKGIIASEEFKKSKSLLTLALGRTTDGYSYVDDLAQMPHLLIAGATGSGKSVCIHSLIVSILYKAKPDELKFLLIDPKRLELPVYNGLPHLFDPSVDPDKVEIITQPKDASESLKKLVKVMESRYEKFAKETVRNIEGYNEKMAQTGGEKEFYIVVIIDELADLMLIATKDIEDSIQRLAQMARAVGIHLILATQRPSVDVITGVIKANFPARIAFQTTSKVDSRVILDYIGAENLVGRGDMLFLPPGESKMTRLQGGYISAKEVEKIIGFIKDQNLKPDYENSFVKKTGDVQVEDDDQTQDELMRALKLVQERKRVSQDLLKAYFGSSARATNLLSLLEVKGFIHKPEGTNRWRIHFEKIDEYLRSAGDAANNGPQGELK